MGFDFSKIYIPQKLPITPLGGLNKCFFFFLSKTLHSPEASPYPFGVLFLTIKNYTHLELPSPPLEAYFKH